MSLMFTELKMNEKAYEANKCRNIQNNLLNL